MPDPSHPQDLRWQNLVRHVREDISHQSPTPPLGFAARVAARAVAHRQESARDPWTWAWRWLLPASTAPALAAVLFYAAVSFHTPPEPEPWALPVDEPILFLDL